MNNAAELDLKEHLCALADNGNSLEALPLLEALEADPSVEARILQSRLVRHLGNESRSHALDILTWRVNADHPEAAIGYARTMMSRRGLYRAWLWMNDNPLAIHATVAVTAEWHALRASIAANLRDWETARRLFTTARELAPGTPWICVEHAHGLAVEDRYDEAIDTARQALDINPQYRSAIQALAHFQSMNGNDEAAFELLQRASARMQNADLEMQLASLLTEHQRYEEAWTTLERARSFSPLSDRARRIWFAAAYAANLLVRGQYRDALAQCRAIGDEFHLSIAGRLEALKGHEAPRRVLLDVGFVRQQFKTCSPATLSSLSNYWGRPAEHLEIAEHICYDGTPHHNERGWTERTGFIAREFTVDWTVATQLIDAGVPFTLTTRYTNFAHLQAVIGYDEIRRSLLLRDPTQRIHTEFAADALFEAQRAAGPRGMLVLPPEEAHRIAHIALPDADYWDSYHESMLALEQHDRASAQTIVDVQRKRAPDHWLTIWGRRSLALYDGDVASSGRFTERLIELFGERAELLLQLQHELEPVESRSKVMEVAERAVRQHPREAALLVRLAGLRTADARDLGEARHLITQALRMAPVDAAAWQSMANVLWLSGSRHAALDHYRIAAGLDDLSESMASAYCRACRALGEGDRGLSLLAERQRRLGDRAAGPTITYFCELENLERTAEAFTVMTKAMQQRPDDDGLRLFCAQKYLQRGEIDKAKATLSAVRGNARTAQRLAVDASLAHREGRVGDAWTAIATACELEPLRIDLRRHAAEILAQLSGRHAAVEYLRDACSKHRTVIALHTLLLEWLASEPPEAREIVMRHVLSLNDSNAFMWRELALNLASQHRLPEAWEAAKVSTALAPRDANTYAVLASLHFGSGDVAAGRENCREALRRSVDQAYAFDTLVTTCNSHEDRLAALELIEAQLADQAATGNALLQFQSVAKSSLPHEKLLARLEALRMCRPELWQAWLAPALQQIDTGKLDDAGERLEAAVEHFPFTARLHYEIARIAAMQRRPLDARESVRRALQLEPAWEWAIRLFVELALQDATQLESALELLDSPLSRSSESAECHMLRSKVLWKLGQRDEAIAVIEQTLLRWPRRVEAWQLAFGWTRERNEAERVHRLALRVTEQHPHDPSGWIRLADSSATLDEAISAVNHALALEPFNQLAYVARLNALMRHHRFDDVREAVRNAPWGEHSPTSIRRYAARALWQQQKADEAFAALRELLTAEPNDFSLWQELSDWLDTTTRFDDHVAAAREMVRLAPGAAIAHGHLGQALRKRSEIEPAINSLRTAFELDHDYAFAGFALVDLLLQNHWQDARPVLAVLRSKFPGTAVALRELQYACAADDLAMMPAPLAEIVRAPESQAEVFRQTEKLLRKGEKRRVLLETIGDACKVGEASEAAISLWLNKEFDLWDSQLLDKLEPYLQVDHDDRLKIQLIESATKLKQSEFMPQFMWKYGATMRTNPRAWGEVSYGFVTLDRFKEAVDWLHDWQRDDSPWWALDNLAIAMRNLDMHDIAHEVSVASQVRNPSRPDATVWLAIDAALGDDFDSLRSWLARTEGVQLRPFYQSIRNVAAGYLKAVDSGRTSHLDSVFAKVRHQSRNQKTLGWAMRQLRRKWANRATGLRKLFRLVLLK